MLGLGVSHARVYDSSAVLAMIFGEPGGDKMAAWVAEGDGVISSVSLAEVLTKLLDHGMDADTLDSVRTGLPLTVEPFTAEQAATAALLRPARGRWACRSATAAAWRRPVTATPKSSPRTSRGRR